MPDYFINIELSGERLKKVEEAGLGQHVTEIGGKKMIQIKANDKEQKKLLKSFPDLTFDSSNACVLPPEAETKLFDIVINSKTVDVMKAAIMKLYNPLAGKPIRSAQR